MDLFITIYLQIVSVVEHRGTIPLVFWWPMAIS